MKLAQIQIYACDRLVISAGPGRENSSHRHFGAIVTIAPEIAGRITELPVVDNQFVRKGTS